MKRYKVGYYNSENKLMYYYIPYANSLTEAQQDALKWRPFDCDVIRVFTPKNQALSAFTNGKWSRTSLQF